MSDFSFVERCVFCGALYAPSDGGCTCDMAVESARSLWGPDSDEEDEEDEEWHR